MLEVALFHNGASDLPHINTAEDVRVTDGSLADVHASNQRGLISQVRQGILAEQLGFNYWAQTEHHFQPEGAEFSPNPLLVETAIAAQTRRIRLMQLANIVPWWHPIRLAEQAAMLDVISGGRLEFGIGRGYQPREAEVFGRPLGSTVQDQERNRRFFEEAVEIILKCWTEPSFSHHGENFSIPPSYTRWNHQSTIAFFNQPNAGRTVADVLHVGAPDMYSVGPPIMANTTTLKELSVFPQPLQKPYPQIWEPVNSERSIRYCAVRGFNAFTVPDSSLRIKHNVAVYYEEAEKQGWPDRLNRGAWKYGWDTEKKRGYPAARWIHIVQPGRDERQQVERYKHALEHQWHYYSPFGISALLADPGEPPPDPNLRITADLVIEKGLAIVGPVDHVIDEIMRLKEMVGYDDFLFCAWLETGGYRGEEVEEQMHLFAGEVLPALGHACGGQAKSPTCEADLLPRQRQPVS